MNKAKFTAFMHDCFDDYANTSYFTHNKANRQTIELTIETFLDKNAQQIRILICLKVVSF